MVSKTFRKPQIYVTLPGETDISNQLPIQSMTVRDDLFLCTPDALMNGQTTVNIIQNCCPTIADPWKIPFHHLYTILAGIKLATEGNTTSMQLRCNECKNLSDYDINIHGLIQNINAKTWLEVIEIKNLKINLKPPSYRVINNWNIHEFRLLKQIAQAQNIEDPIAQDEVLQVLMSQKNAFHMQKYVQCVESITLDEKIVSNPQYIDEFLKNTETDIAMSIEKIIDKAFLESKLGQVKIVCGQCKKEFVLPVDFDFCTNFRMQLVMSSDEEIVSLLEKMTKQQKDIRNDLLKAIWFMRGSITYDDSYMLTRSEREQIGKLIEENLEVSKKTGMNFF